MDRRDVPKWIGPFRIERRLGAGGMAETFVGVQLGPGGFEQRVCVKRILPAFASDRELVRLFVREARIAAELSHRNITRVVEFGEDAGAHYLALELVDGMDLRALLSTLPPPHQLDPGIVALIGLEMADALAHAHTRRGIVHRDVSPANVLLSVDGEVKLSDFGISKPLAEPVTRSGVVRGNAWYMAPERIEEHDRCDPRSDLFSLGVVLFHCAAGRRPYEAESFLEAMRAACEGRRIPLSTLAPGMPHALVCAIERLLAPRPDDRFAHAASLADALAPLAPVHSARQALAALVRELRTSADERRFAEAPTLDLREASGKRATRRGRVAKRRRWHASLRGLHARESIPVALRPLRRTA